MTGDGESSDVLVGVTDPWVAGEDELVVEVCAPLLGGGLRLSTLTVVVGVLILARIVVVVSVVTGVKS